MRLFDFFRYFMRDINSLRLNKQFKRAYTKGKYRATPCLVLYAVKSVGEGGFGITASKKIGGAVERNRAKRRIRALYRNYRHLIKDGFDIVAVARSKTVYAPFSELEKSFLEISGALGILKDEEE